MALNRKQIKQIRENYKNSTPEKLAKELNAPVEEVQIVIEAATKKAPFYFYIILILIPILFFVLLETGLRIFNYGYDLTMWVNVIEGKYIINPDVARRYFSSIKGIPSSIEDIFDEKKAPNSYRVFVLGASSAAGYPYMPMGSFSRYIRKRLELSYPNKKIEVINIALSATNSYTVRDFIPEVLEQQPDLILIYSGHNEYYGALGVGSIESVSSSRELVNLLLYLNRFKTTQLVKDFIQWVAGIFASGDEKSTGTLMSRMAKEKYIELNSENYYLGLDQFEGNLKDILEMVKEKNVPIIISNLASNLKDQFPFISIKNGKLPPADRIYYEAERAYKNGEYAKADSLYRYAKDLDGLRFRAPEKINEIIKRLGSQFEVPVINVDSLFSSLSPNGIVGNNLMTDHLHPTLDGFQKIGKLFYEEMQRRNYLPKNPRPQIPFEKQDSLTISDFVFSEFDSVVAQYRILLLKNDWPFIDPKLKRTYYEVCRPANFVDSTAVAFLQSKLSWGEAIERVAERYFVSRNLDGYLEHMETLIYQYPIIVENYMKLEEIALRFLKIKDYKNAAKVLSLEYKLAPNAFSAKWLGQIELYSNNIAPAIKFLTEAIKYNPSDEQVMFNLAGAYALNKEYEKGLEIISKLIGKNPGYPGAQNLYNQLKGIIQYTSG